MTSILPLLAKPIALSTVNRLARPKNASTSRIIQFIVVIFSLALLLLIGKGTSEVLTRIREYSDFLYLAPAQPIALVLFLLLLMLVVSNAALAVGLFFLGRDLDLLVASPTNSWRFFSGKYLVMFASSSWMPLIFLAPFLWAFGYHYDVPWSYYPLSLLILVPYFAIAASSGLILVVSIAMLLSAKYTKETLLVCILLVITAISIAVSLIDIRADKLASSSEVFRLLSMLSMSHHYWLPSNWAAGLLQQFLAPELHTAPQVLQVYLSAALALFSISFLLVHVGVTRGISNLQSVRQSHSHTQSQWPNKLSSTTFGLTRTERGLLSKDLYVYLRDMTQLAQLVVLIVLCCFYLYNVKIFRAVNLLPHGTQYNWRNVLFIINIAMGTFIAIAVGSRFIFPSISLEGAGYWIIRTAPITSYQFISSKFRYWYPPVTSVTGLFFCIGAYTIGADWSLIALHAFAAVVISYGIVGLAIGFGALYAHFDWEYSTELAASFGGFVFMLCGIMFVMASIIPLLLLAWLVQFGGSMHSLSLFHYLCCVGGIGILFLMASVGCARFMLSQGALSLSKRE
jgi:ABC-2 type transport system permease protein